MRNTILLKSVMDLPRRLIGSSSGRTWVEGSITLHCKLVDLPLFNWLCKQNNRLNSISGAPGWRIHTEIWPKTVILGVPPSLSPNNLRMALNSLIINKSTENWREIRLVLTVCISRRNIMRVMNPTTIASGAKLI